MDEKDRDEQEKAPDKKLNLAEWVSAKSIEYKSEFKKIIWPSQKSLYKQTLTVTVVSLLFGVIVFGMDSVYSLALQLFVNFISRG